LNGSAPQGTCQGPEAAVDVLLMVMTVVVVVVVIVGDLGSTLCGIE